MRGLSFEAVGARPAGGAPGLIEEVSSNGLAAMLLIHEQAVQVRPAPCSPE